MIDDALGMILAIDRREFLDGVVGTAALAADLGGATAARAAKDAPGYNPPLFTGMRGSHPSRSGTLGVRCPR